MSNIILDKDNKLWWPKWEARPGAHYSYHTKHLREIEYAMSISKKGGMCIQAGGNVGIWPNKLIEHFGEVYSFEADPDLYECLTLNKKSDKIYPVNCALGAQNGKARFNRTGKSGTGYISDTPREKDSGFDVEIRTIDSWNFTSCDAMFLDVEGYEEAVLEGAFGTISRFKPIIQTELLDRSKDIIQAKLKSLGYKLITLKGKDGVFRYGK